MIDNSNKVELVKMQVLRGTYISQISLFTQAIHECHRLNKLRDVISKLEASLFDSTAWDKLHVEDKMKLYAVISGTQNNSLRIMQLLETFFSGQSELLNQISEIENSQVRNLKRDNSKCKISEIKTIILKHCNITSSNSK